jgi:hypothetical protein
MNHERALQNLMDHHDAIHELSTPLPEDRKAEQQIMLNIALYANELYEILEDPGVLQYPEELFVDLLVTTVCVGRQNVMYMTHVDDMCNRFSDQLFTCVQKIARHMQTLGMPIEMLIDNIPAPDAHDDPDEEDE